MTLGGSSGGSEDAGTTVTATTIYAHTDTVLYSMNPQSKAVALIGTFTGLSGSSGDDSITDLAVNAAGNVYVNSETVIYKASIPPGGTGSVALTSVATIAVQSGQSFYALGFTPANALGAGTGEVLIGGDGNGELWAISTANGATKDLGGFGPDPNDASSTFELSGDVVFYTANGKSTGLATIRACSKSGSCGTDYLAGIDMNALATAYSSGVPAATLNAGIYGSPSTSNIGVGIGYHDVFGLGAWSGNVYGFTRAVSGAPASLVLIDTSTGAGTLVPETVSITSGWSGAGVTTTVTVNVPPPPPPPK